MASPKKSALGRGLSALLEDIDSDLNSSRSLDSGDSHAIGSVANLAISKIEANPFQPRTRFETNALDELAESISQHGIIQPVTVRKMGDGTFQLISGERRFRASQLAGLSDIPAYIRLANDQTMLEMALVENIQRQDLDPIEIALSYQRLIDEIQLTQEQMSERVGKKRSTIANYLRLLKLDPIIQTGMRDGFLSMGHGRAIINIEDQNIQLEIYEKILSNKLSVRDTETLVRNYNTTNEVKTPVKKEAEELPKYVKKGVAAFSEYFGHKIDVKVASNGKGKITIPFHSEEDFNRIKKLVEGDK